MAWFAKVVGMLQRHVQVVSGLGLAVLVAGSAVPQTLGLSYYRRMLTHYKHNEPVPVDSNLKELIDKVVARVNLRPEQEVKLDFITSFPSDPVHKGSVQLRTGSFIGLPSTFTCRSVDEIDRSSILVEQRFIDWTSPMAESLLESVVLTDKAKAFVIAREIQYTSSFSVQVDVILRGVCGALAYWTGFALNQKMFLTQRLKLGARFGIFSTIASGWLLLYIAFNDAYYCWLDNHVDRSVAKLNRVYAEGGIDYYNSVLRRNQALRSLLKSEGEKRFTKFGNVVTVLRTPHVQLTSRRDNLQKHLIEYWKC